MTFSNAKFGFKCCKYFKFYSKYYITNHLINHIPCHALRLWWYRSFMKIKIGIQSQIWLGCRFVGDAIHEIEIGDYSVLASDVVVNASAPVKIGDHVSIAHGVQILTADHDCQDSLFAFRKAPVYIHSYAWLATRAMILKGVAIGEGAVVTAGSVVAHDAKPLAIIAGNPARQVGTRVKPEIQEPTNSRPPLFC